MAFGSVKIAAAIGMVLGASALYVGLSNNQIPEASPEIPIALIARVDGDDLNQQGLDIETQICGTKFSDDGETEVCEERTLFGRNLLWTPADVTIDNEQVTKILHSKINSYRQENGLSTLRYNSDLAEIAKAHADDMAKYRYFSHINMDDDTPTARGEQAGYDCERSDGIFIYSGIGENLAYTFAHEQDITFVSGTPMPVWVTDSQTIADDVFELWRTSPGHNANLLESEYRHEGLGIVLNDHGEIFSVQNFAVCEA